MWDVDRSIENNTIRIQKQLDEKLNKNDLPK